jgi:putative chitinase
MLLRIGSKNEQVQKLQIKLGQPADGVFGIPTAKAVKQWQQAHGLTADGIVGDLTWNTLFEIDATKNVVSDAVVQDNNPPADNKASENKTSSAVAITTVTGLNLTKLKGQIPDAVIAQIPACAAEFAINTPLRLAHFLAQCAHESMNFKATQENLNYSADGLKKIFGKYFPGNLATNYARQPEKIAARVYANRMGNGDEASKEGYKYRGRGFIQLTGKSNYTEFSKKVKDDILNNPDLVATKYPLLSAAWYWNSRSLNHSADKGATDATVTEVTKKVNGGTIGLADRLHLFKKYYKLLN